jgi:hypothetical protein
MSGRNGCRGSNGSSLEVAEVPKMAGVAEMAAEIAIETVAAMAAVVEAAERAAVIEVEGAAALAEVAVGAEVASLAPWLTWQQIRLSTCCRTTIEPRTFQALSLSLPFLIGQFYNVIAAKICYILRFWPRKVASVNEALVSVLQMMI